MHGSFRIGRIFGIPVGLHWSLLAIGALLAYQLADGLLPDAHPGHGTAAYVLVGCLGTALFFLTVLAHELAHALTAHHYAMRVEGIDLWALGGVTRMRSAARTPRAEWRVAAAGPLVSLLCAALAAVSAFLVERQSSGLLSVALWWLAIVNAILAVFNVLPAAPLDGGRILSGLLWKRHGDRFRASRTAALAGWMLGWLLFGMGVALALRHRNGIFSAFVGLFLVVAARAEDRATDMRATIAGTRVRDVTWFGVARASGDSDVSSMLGQRLRMGGLGIVAVVDRDGKVTGLVSEGQLRRARERGKGSSRLADLAVPVDRVGRAELDDELSDALSRLRPRLPVLTVWDSGDLVGVVAGDAVEERLAGAAR